MPLDLPAPVTRFAAWWMYPPSVLESLARGRIVLSIPGWGIARHESGTWQKGFGFGSIP
jgi:hypothetical protein